MAVGASELTLARGVDRGLLWTTCLSALVHVVLFGAALLLPAYFLATPPRIESYTVDLVAPDVLGGTNLNSAGSTSAPPVARAAAMGPAQAGVSIADARPVIPEAAVPKPAERAASATKVNPEPEPLKSSEGEIAPSAASAKPLAAKAPLAAPDAVKAPPAPPKPKPPDASKPKPRAIVPAAAKPAPPKPPDESNKKSKQVSSAASSATAVPAAPAGSTSTKGPSQVSPRKVAANPARTNVPTPKAAEPTGASDRDRAIAAAVQRRAAESASKAKTQSAVDQRIAAAVQRRAAQVSAGAAKPQAAAGGPVSSGPGDALGGRRADLQYVLYQGRMEERVKQSWAWAGADPSLRATVQFSIMPDGEIRNVRIMKASGDASYDASVERAIRAVSPLDPPPERLREDFALVELTFQPEQGR